MASDITITSLTAVGGLGQVAVTVLASSPAGMTCLPYMQPASIDIYASATNNTTTATKVGTINSAVGVFIHGGLGDNVARYYWAVPRDADGNEGARYPATTAGVAATTKTAQPGPDSVGSTELQNGAVTEQKIANLAVTNAKIASLSAEKIVATNLSAISADLGTITAGSVTGVTFTGGLFRTAVSGRRIEISAATNSLTARNPNGTPVVVINDAGFYSAIINGVGWESEPQVANFGSNTTAGANTPAVRISRMGTANAPALDVYANNTGGDAHSIRFFNAGSAGQGAIGVSVASGGYAFISTRGGYGPFTGAHDAFIHKEATAEIGDIVCDLRVLSRNGISDTVTEVAVTDQPAARNVAGVVAARVPFDEDSILAALDPERLMAGRLRRWLAEKFDRLTINGVGEGQVNVCGRNGDIAAGDYITTSSLPGKGQRQDDDIKRACTVARAREAVTFDHPDQVKRVACFYECG